MQRGMEEISLWHCSGVMEAQVALIAAFRSSALLGLVSLIFLLTIPTHLVTWLLVNLPHLSFLVTLLICSLYNLLVFAFLCQFIIVSTLVAVNVALPCLALPCLALPCLALPCLASCPAFTLRGSFSLFVLFLNNKIPFYAVLSPRLIHSPHILDNMISCSRIISNYYYYFNHVKNCCAA